MFPKRILFAAFTLCVCLLPAGGAFAQLGGLGNMLNGRQVETDGDGRTMADWLRTQGRGGEVAADSLAREFKTRKPLESYFFNDSIRDLEIFVWNVSTMRNEVRMSGVDTSIGSFQPFYPFLRKGSGTEVGEANLGVMGGASMPLNYYERSRHRDFSFAGAFDSYFIWPETARFFNVKKPFTQFSYYTMGPRKYNEEGFYINHAQNISPSSGFNIDYRTLGTRGYYAYSKARSKALSAVFSHTGKKYTVHAGYLYNSIDNRENGGLVDDRMITDTIVELPENIPVQLQSARNVIKNNALFLVQSYGIPLRRLTDSDFSIADRSSVFVGHSTVLSRWTKTYTDRWESGEDFYDHWYVNARESRDSVAETLFSNRVFAQIQPWDRDGVVGLVDAGAGVDVHHYYMFRPSDYLTRYKGVDKSDYYIYGAVKGKFRRYFDWGGEARFDPAGSRSGDVELGAHASLSAFVRGRAITLAGRFSYGLRTPDFWSGSYFSNHFVWSNDFAKENETRLDVSLSIPSVAFEVGVQQSVAGDKIYYDAAAMPTQYGGSVSVSGLYVKKDFRLGGFHLGHRVLVQESSAQSVIPVPLASAWLSYFFEFNVVKNVLRMQLGFDARYNTPYYAPGYMPATAQFYNQREKELGGYPLIDVFASAKWKRMRILLKYEHMNEDMFGRRNYFQVLHYPQRRMMLKYGFSWAFYD